ncbi:MAG: M56 family metallopeptidase [Gemmatimonadales bacterium]
MTWIGYATLVALLAAAAGRVAERWAESAGRPRRWAWLAALVLSLGLPVGLALRPVRIAAGGGAAVEAVGPEAAPTGAVSSTATLSSRLHWFDRPATALWGALSGMLLVWTTLGVLRGRRITRRASPAVLDGEAVRLADSDGPAVFGLFAPEIVVPRWVAGLDPADRALLLAHEAEHRGARDPLLLALADLAVAVFPWNAGLWIQRRRLRRAIEIDCDERVLARHGSVDRYGRLLLAVADRLVTEPGSALAFARRTSLLRVRIASMLADRPGLGSAERVRLALGLGVLAVIGCAAPVPEPLEVDRTAAAVTEVEVPAAMIRAEVEAQGRFRVRPDTGKVGVAEVVVYNAVGKPVKTFQLRPDGSTEPGAPSLKDFPAASIERVEVIKRPAGARIEIRLKGEPGEVREIPQDRSAGTLVPSRRRPIRDIVMRVDGDRISINDQAVAEGEVAATLRRIYAGRPNPELVLITSPASSKAQVERAMTAARAAGVTAIERQVLRQVRE